MRLRLFLVASGRTHFSIECENRNAVTGATSRPRDAHRAKLTLIEPSTDPSRMGLPSPPSLFLLSRRSYYCPWVTASRIPEYGWSANARLAEHSSTRRSKYLQSRMTQRVPTCRTRSRFNFNTPRAMTFARDRESSSSDSSDVWRSPLGIRSSIFKRRFPRARSSVIFCYPFESLSLWAVPYFGYLVPF